MNRYAGFGSSTKHAGGPVRYSGNSTFKAGLVLEQAVSDGLAQLGIEHRRTEHSGKEDVLERVDLIVSPVGGRRPLEIQITLRAKNYGKIFGFARRALTTTTRGIRLYIEVVGLHRRSADLKAVGYRVAEAIRVIVRQFRDFGVWNLLGVRIHAFTAKIEKFDLIDFCGHKLIRLVEAWWEERRRIDQERRAAEQAAIKERLSAPKPPPFWRALIQPTITRAYMGPTRPSPQFDTRAYFMPRRFC